MSLLQLPTELREKIYYYVSGSEQEQFFENIGLGQDKFRDNWCLPLRKVRPPLLIRVCKILRYEYLPYYFGSTCFRIYIDISTAERAIEHNNSIPVLSTQLPAAFHFAVFPPVTPSMVAPEQRITPPLEETILERSAKDWLDSLRSRDGVHFRRVQLRLMNGEGQPIGASLNISYNARAKMYEVDFKLDQGWDRSQDIVGMGLLLNVNIGPSQVVGALREICELASDEALDRKAVEYLMKACKVHHLSTQGVEVSVSIREWSQEVKLGIACNAAVATAFHKLHISESI